VKRYSEAFGLWPGDLNIPETAGPHSPDKRWRDVPQFSFSKKGAVSAEAALFYSPSFSNRASAVRLYVLDHYRSAMDARDYPPNT
jgi:hypothetical protein